MPPFALPRWDTGVKRSSSCVQSLSGTAVIALIGVIAAGSSAVVKEPGCSSGAFPFLPKSSQGATFTAQFFAMGNCFGSRGNSIAPLRPILSNTQPATWAPCPKGWAQGCAKVGSGCSIFTNGTTFWSRRERASASSLRVALFWHSSLYPENNATPRLPAALPQMHNASVCATSQPSSPRLAARTARRAPERSSRASLLRRAVRGSIYARANRSSPRP